jgi:hypothetical protein
MDYNTCKQLDTTTTKINTSNNYKKIQQPIRERGKDQPSKHNTSLQSTISYKNPIPYTPPNFTGSNKK